LRGDDRQRRHRRLADRAEQSLTVRAATPMFEQTFPVPIGASLRQ
jgi:hypothetical protein